jgi:hypothetical protein
VQGRNHECAEGAALSRIMYGAKPSYGPTVRSVLVFFFFSTQANQKHLCPRPATLHARLVKAPDWASRRRSERMAVMQPVLSTCHLSAVAASVPRCDGRPAFRAATVLSFTTRVSGFNTFSSTLCHASVGYACVSVRQARRAAPQAVICCVPLVKMPSGPTSHLYDTNDPALCDRLTPVNGE